MSSSDAGEGNINEILLDIGVPGKYQLNSFFWTFLIGIITAFQTVAIPFTQADMNYRCAYDEANLSWLSAVDEYNNTCSQFSTGNESVECLKFEYDPSVFENTVTSQFNLVCSRFVFVTISNMLYSALAIPGGIMAGWLSDRFGRKLTIIAHLVIVGGIGIATAFSINIEMYIAMRCLMNIPTVGIYDSSNTLLSEITSPVKRPHVLIGSVMSWSLSICLISALAYWLTDWFYLQIAISVPNFLLAAAAWWAYDESPHWLYSKKRYDEAQEVLNKIARWNKCTEKNTALIYQREGKKKEPVPKGSNEEDIDAIEMKEGTAEIETSSNACLKILCQPRFVAVFLICSLGWFSCNLGYYGLLVSVGDLVGDIYVNNVVGGLTELVAYSLCFLILKGGRKIIYIGLVLIGGIGLISSAIAGHYLPGVIWLIVLLTMVGRLCLSAAWQVLYVWCLELFPTSARITMLQGTLVAGHIGSTTGFFMADLPQFITNKNIQADIIAPITYGVFLIVSGITSLYLPETNNKPLPVTIDDAIRALQRKPQAATSVDYDEQTKL